MLRRLVLVAALALVAACPGAKTVVAPPPNNNNNNDDGQDAPDRVREVEATVLENYRLFASSAASYAQTIARDRPVAIAGITPNMILVGEWPEGIEKDRRPYQAKAVRILSKNLEVHVASNPSVAWVSDELSYRVPYKGREASVPIRFTGVYVRDIDRWLLVLEHMSYALPAQELVEKARNNELSILPPLPKRTAPSSSPNAAKIEANIEAALRRWHRPGVPMSSLVVADTDALVLWPDPDTEYRGLAASAAPKLVDVFGDGAVMEQSEYRVFVGGNEQVAWAIANHHIRLPSKHVIEVRASYVLEVRGDQHKWFLVQAHASVPLHIKQISERVFGLRRH